MARRSYGTGSLFVYRNKWYGQWRTGGRLVKRAIGPKREQGTNEGLTRSQAERKLRQLMVSEARAKPLKTARMNLEDVGKRYIDHLEALGRKRSTVTDYRSYLRVHLAPFFNSKALDKIGAEDVEAFMAAKRREGKAPKSILSYLTLLQSIFDHAIRRKWCQDNPCSDVEKPRIEDATEIRFLDQDELEAVLAVKPEHDFDPMLRTMFLSGAMTGLRLGELRALRWRDVDWPASRVRVRQNYVRGEFGTPKSRRSSRSVPLADRAAGELDQLFQRSEYQGDDELVFGNPQTGKPISASFVEQRFRWALGKAEVRQVRVNDLRHTFGTRMAAAGVPMRTLQEWMGHRDFKTTLIYADYAPSPLEGELVERAFKSGHQFGHQSEQNSDDLSESQAA